MKRRNSYLLRNRDQKHVSRITCQTVTEDLFISVIPIHLVYKSLFQFSESLTTNNPLQTNPSYHGTVANYFKKHANVRAGNIYIFFSDVFFHSIFHVIDVILFVKVGYLKSFFNTWRVGWIMVFLVLPALALIWWLVRQRISNANCKHNLCQS